MQYIKLTNYKTYNFILLEVYLIVVQIFLSARCCALYWVCNGKYSLSSWAVDLVQSIRCQTNTYKETLNYRIRKITTLPTEPLLYVTSGWVEVIREQKPSDWSYLGKSWGKVQNVCGMCHIMGLAYAESPEQEEFSPLQMVLSEETGDN